MQIKKPFRVLLFSVGLSGVEAWSNVETVSTALQLETLAQDEKDLLTAVLGPHDRINASIIERQGGKYFSPSMIKLLIESASGEHNPEGKSAMVWLRDDLETQRRWSHVIQNMPGVGRTGIEEILEFLGLK